MVRLIACCIMLSAVAQPVLGQADAKKLKELEDRIAQLEQTLKDLAQRLAAIEKKVAPVPAKVGVDSATIKTRLLVVRGTKLDVDFPLFEGQNVLGRGDEKPVDVELEFLEPADRIYSSRQHAVITREGQKLHIEDLNSANGTYVNRQRVPPGKKQELMANDVIQIGTIHLKVVIG